MAAFRDVRMTGFAARTPVADVLALLDARVTALSPETVPVVSAAGRVLAAPVASAVNVPAFPRCMMDGYAVRAADTGPRRVVGVALPGRPFVGLVGAGGCVRVTTGAALPAGADAVLMAEFAEAADDRVATNTTLIPGKHVGRVGEDVAAGREVLPTGRVLRPQDVGLLVSIGVATVDVVRRPRVAILVTGDELLPPGSPPAGERIVDSNSPMLAALVARDGGVCEPTRYLSDRFEVIRDALRDADADVVLMSGGTSVGTEDHAPLALAAVGELAVHGIAVKPAGPAGVGFVGGRIVFLLPGNPVSNLCAYDLFAGRTLRQLGGRSRELPYRSARLPLGATLDSAVGRTDYVRVKVENGIALPLAGGASNLSGAVIADGFTLVPAECAEVAAGEVVEVWFYDGS